MGPLKQTPAPDRTLLSRVGRVLDANRPERDRRDDAKGRPPSWPVSFQREDGAVTGEMTVLWTLRPNSPDSSGSS
ncbi:hypothetical protein AB0O78_38360, partial [Streptomyces griseoviridis]